ncbi:MAG: UDP-N-acetylmuramoyl-L-alanyl-D-glutamate--2,6-diaminopimelate ligase [Alphaproteobacteria bacterium]|nr:UDP-N-acetylmuramoyl-L-alanyl-D-glutamate--2,6-diaminopimelate ligase [Alphaproteobacteria bacterium]
MLLSELTLLPFTGADVDISGITEDSRKVKSGFLFIATPGVKLDGRAFIGDAIGKGAVAVLLPEGSQTCASVTTITTPDIRKATSALAAAFHPRQPETLVAVTGTSGKTSTAQFAREIWQALGHQSASIGTLGLVTGAGTHYGSLTTPDAITLHHLLDDCAGQGITHVAMEASSHGIELGRLDQARLKAGAFTNLSRDHLDYHETLEAYFAAKTRLFSTLLPQGAAAVLNADVPQFSVLSDIARQRGLKIVSYGKNAADLRLIEATPCSGGQILRLEIFRKSVEVLLPVSGDFQAWNALCAAGLVIGSGSPAEAAIEALAKVSGVPGRLQFIGLSQKGGEVYVDYAHKPDALENVLRALRAHVAAHEGARLGVVFGCGGNRDRGKRPIMGDIAQRQADWVIVTDDNPRNEQPADIRAEILAGCADKSNVKEIGDRAEAIAAGINRLNAHDVVVIAGKGHEPGQIVGDKVLPFDDAEEARRVLGILQKDIKYGI